MNSSINASKIIIDNEDDKIISIAEAEEAVKTLIRYIGEDPEREGLMVTIPKQFCEQKFLTKRLFLPKSFKIIFYQNLLWQFFCLTFFFLSTEFKTTYFLKINFFFAKVFRPFFSPNIF